MLSVSRRGKLVSCAMSGSEAPQDVVATSVATQTKHTTEISLRSTEGQSSTVAYGMTSTGLSKELTLRVTDNIAPRVIPSKEK